ncbi:MAG: GntR family transcriptional regulator [Prevotella sp.]|nr:GntR family transcriptional regulator [Candidatus Prevotella equi]
MQQLKLGQKNKLKAAWRVDFGMYLEGGGYEGKILLPERYVPEDLEVGDEIEVFLYLDNEERLIATTLEPKAMVGDFAYLEVAWVNEFGAFLDWGLMKDLFCPFREQKRRMEKGRSYIVHVHVDEDSYRIMASAKVERYLAHTAPYEDGTPGEPIPYKVDDEVELLVWQKTDLGFKVIIDNHFAGLLYDTEIFRNLHTGDVVKGYIKNVRPDGKIDVKLQKTGRQHTEDFSARLLRYLETQGGRCRLHDKSDAEEIKEQFGVSKRTYKQAVGDLYKKRLIVITENGIELV